jgi:hypothetical protein
MNECKAKGWIKISKFGGGYNKLSITNFGRKLVEAEKSKQQKTV